MKRFLGVCAGLSVCFFAWGSTTKPYFQQEVNYQIQVKLDDVKHELNAEE